MLPFTSRNELKVLSRTEMSWMDIKNDIKETFVGLFVFLQLCISNATKTYQYIPFLLMPDGV